jgi:hypothetical protein
MPFQLRPNFNQTQSFHLFKLNKFTRQSLSILLWTTHTRLVKFARIIIYLFQPIYYCVVVVKLAPMVQTDHLMYLNKLNSEELTTKVIYTVPLATKSINLIQLVVFLVASVLNHYDEWYTYDSYQVFAIKPMAQFKIMAIVSLLLLPDYIRTCLDTMFMVNSVLRSTRNEMCHSILEPATMNALITFMTLGVTSTTFFLKYKPFVNVLYSEICLRQHMKTLYLKLINSYYSWSTGTKSDQLNEINSGDLLFAGGVSTWHVVRFPSAASEIDDDRRPSSSKSTYLTSRNGSLLSRLIHNEQFRNPPPFAGPSDCSASSRTGELNRLTRSLAQMQRTRIGEPISELDSIPTVPGRHSNVNELVGSNTSNQEPAAGEYVISSLFELERHLTQLYLFVTAIDRQSPAAVYSVIVANVMLILHASLYVREIPLEEVNWFFVFVFCTGPFFPVFVLLLVGHLIEFENKHIITLMEKVYFEDSSQMLLYRQMKDSQYSLLRIFKLLDRIKFTCDHLLIINMETFKNLAFYILSGMFVVVQYDLLLAAKIDSGNQIQTATGIQSGHGNKTNWLWNRDRPINVDYKPQVLG